MIMIEMRIISTLFPRSEAIPFLRKYINHFLRLSLTSNSEVFRPPRIMKSKIFRLVHDHRLERKSSNSSSGKMAKMRKLAANLSSHRRWGCYFEWIAFFLVFQWEFRQSLNSVDASLAVKVRNSQNLRYRDRVTFSLVSCKCIYFQVDPVDAARAISPRKQSGLWDPKLVFPFPWFLVQRVTGRNRWNEPQGRARKIMENVETSGKKKWKFDKHYFLIWIFTFFFLFLRWYRSEIHPVRILAATESEHSGQISV